MGTDEVGSRFDAVAQRLGLAFLLEEQLMTTLSPLRCSLQLVSAALLATCVAAQTPSLLRDVNKAPLTTPSSSPTNGLAFGGWTYFSATTPDTGRELFRTGATPGTTELVADLEPGAASSSPRDLTVFLGQLWFSADGSLWRSDGTTAGTIAVRSFATGPSGLTVLGAELLFVAGDIWTDSELWKTDGTTAGTVKVADIHPGSSSSGPKGITAYQGVAYFGATNGVNGSELWRSDGTTAGTFMVRDIHPGNRSSAPQVFATLSSGVFFFAQGASGNGELWTTDGTTEGTKVVREIRPGTAGSVGVTNQLVVAGGALFFVANDGTHGQELWTSDGTAAGTSMVLDVSPGSSGGSSEPLVGAGGTVFFGGSTPGTGLELWASDGTTAGTRMVADINPGAASGLSLGFTARQKIALGTSLLFGATDGQTGIEPWMSDGASVTRLANIAPSSTSSTPEPLAVDPTGAHVFFSADDSGVIGRELYATDGTPAGTQLWDDINTIGEETAGSNPTTFKDVFGRVFFIANDGTQLNGPGSITTGPTPWITDGTTAGTSQIAPVFTQATSTAATLDGRWLFKAYTATHGDEPWRSDGTAAGTAMIADLNPGAGNSRVHDYTLTGEKTMLVTSTLADRLWHTDGFEVTAVTALGQTNQIYNLVQLDGLLLFATASGFPPSDLWRSDGTPAGTYSIGWFDPYEIVAAEGKGFFSTIFPPELWHTDGTAAGTKLLKTFPNLQARDLTAVGSSLFFVVPTSSAGAELWYSNGLPAGTRMVKDIIPGSAGSNPSSLAPFRGGVLFSARTPATGEELWFSDGTSAGTVMVTDLVPGSTGSVPSEIVAIGSRRAVFSADDGVRGRELWITDGTSAGTKLLGDLNANGDSDPTDMTVSGGRVVFSADDGIHGREPWVFDPGAIAQPIGMGCAIPGGLRPILESQDPVLGNSVEITARVLATNSTHVLLFGAPRAGLQWSGDCFLYLDPGTISVLASTSSVGQRWGLAMPLPLIPVLDGVQAGLQVISALSSGDIEFSNAVSWTLGF